MDEIKKIFQGFKRNGYPRIISVEGYPYPDFVELENRGLTTVFYRDSFLLKDYTACKKNLQELLVELDHSNLKLMVSINGFSSFRLIFFSRPNQPGT